MRETAANTTASLPRGNLILAGGTACGDILVCHEGISFWGGVDPETGQIIDAHHPDHGASLAGRVVLMPTSRGSCSGSGVLLQLALNGNAPAALVFCKAEETLTLGALVAGHIFQSPVTVISLCADEYARLATAHHADIADGALVATDLPPAKASPADKSSGELVSGRIKSDKLQIALEPLSLDAVTLSARDQQMRAGDHGPAAAIAMDIICRLATVQGARSLRDVTRGHIDGCILAHQANLAFARKMAEMGAQIIIPTTTNAISVDRENWQHQGVAPSFAQDAAALADSYIAMGAQPSFTCAPYLLDAPPGMGDCIGWSESNAVIYANSVLGARTSKLPDFLDLFVAMTGRAPVCGAYTDEGRRPARIIDVSLPDAGYDESIWSILGWTIGSHSPDSIPLVRGLETLPLGTDDLKAICAAFGTTSGAPMLHIAGHTPESGMPPHRHADIVTIDQPTLAKAWQTLNAEEASIDLVAVGSPHASLDELHRIVDLFGRRTCPPDIHFIVCAGRDVIASAGQDGTAGRLKASGVRLVADICWCSMTEPVFPPDTKVLITNSGKYAHYADGLNGRKVRLAGLEACVEAALTGTAPAHPPDWVSRQIAD